MNYTQLAHECLTRADELAACTESPGILKRTFLSEPMRRAHALVRDYMQGAGMQVRVDALGNIVGRLEGKGPKAFLTGSHLDTVPDAGKYDGMLGVLIGIAAASAIGAQNLAYHFDVIGFSDEEGVRYKMPYLGSLAVAGLFKAEYLARVDERGVTMADAIKNFGLNGEDFKSAAYNFADVAGFAEVHIEQGPVLEAEGLALGAVTGLVGQSRVKLFYRGLASHAGTTPMRGRRDAFTALSELNVFVEKYALSIPNLVATVGMAQVRPGGANVIPGEVYFSLDIRHGDQPVLDRATEVILGEATAIASRRNIEMVIETQEAQAVVKCEPLLVNKMASAMEFHSHRPYRLASGAGHDTAILSKVTPTAMLFIRSPGGISHNPIETVTVEDVAAAIEVFVTFLRSL
ncbi:Zn-dependent hydrolase [Turneriella parva]|uniref:Amidase, hydantoinase/carbamoylase family n=1 Tax=Turneriella parva (strain ATCC BAA-1111 / DSM 21527 / NCTC 11395 / H) TaxID=869212 RepID=I4B3T5_TURPD|nr:Zn-dependent hydrolase [Turneriella parva]AFM11942.1 amidase, hydantoinase/carbamoylase family [Turneriella parva DSM 21527]